MNSIKSKFLLFIHSFIFIIVFSYSFDFVFSNQKETVSMDKPNKPSKKACSVILEECRKAGYSKKLSREKSETSCVKNILNGVIQPGVVVDPELINECKSKKINL